MYHFTVDVALAMAEGLEEERGGEQEEGEQHLGRGQGLRLHPDLGPERRRSCRCHPIIINEEC